MTSEIPLVLPSFILLTSKGLQKVFPSIAGWSHSFASAANPLQSLNSDKHYVCTCEHLYLAAPGGLQEKLFALCCSSTAMHSIVQFSYDTVEKSCYIGYFKIEDAIM